MNSMMCLGLVDDSANSRAIVQEFEMVYTSTQRSLPWRTCHGRPVLLFQFCLSLSVNSILPVLFC